MPSDADTSMNKTFLFWILSAGLLLAGACNKMDNLADLPDPADATQQKINFDVLVTREGKVVTKAGSGVMTKSGNEAYEEGTQQATQACCTRVTILFAEKRKQTRSDSSEDVAH